MPTVKTKERADKVAELKSMLAEFLDDMGDEEKAACIAEVQGYSERNCYLIAMQCPHATELHGFKAWLELGRCVRKGEKGIQILAPAGKIEKDEKDPNSEEKMFFRVAYIFDISQTDPK